MENYTNDDLDKAIELLMKIESEHRQPTEEEAVILSAIADKIDSK